MDKMDKMIKYYDIDSFKYAELRNFCREYKLGTIGSKEELKQRVWNFINTYCYNDSMNILYKIVDKYIILAD